MAGRTPALTWRTLAALRATLANSSELAAPFPGRFSGADAPCDTICMCSFIAFVRVPAHSRQSAHHHCRSTRQK